MRRFSEVKTLTLFPDRFRIRQGWIGGDGGYVWVIFQEYHQPHRTSWRSEWMVRSATSACSTKQLTEIIDKWSREAATIIALEALKT